MLIYRLEKIVFGDVSDVINNLPDENHIKVANESLIADNAEANSDGDSNGDLDEDSDEQQTNRKKVVWVDEDDAHYT